MAWTLACCFGLAVTGSTDALKKKKKTLFKLVSCFALSSSILAIWRIHYLIVFLLSSTLCIQHMVLLCTQNRAQARRGSHEPRKHTHTLHWSTIQALQALNIRPNYIKKAMEISVSQKGNTLWLWTDQYIKIRWASMFYREFAICQFKQSEIGSLRVLMP